MSSLKLLVIVLANECIDSEYLDTLNKSIILIILSICLAVSLTLYLDNMSQIKKGKMLNASIMV